MELLSQHAKKIMEGCKERARDAGLRFQDDSLEYIVTNRDFLRLTPKNMIPTLYDYWVQDVEVMKEAGQYELYPTNPYETVINTRPPISYYNDNNPDWLNVMIFYHVLGHIDFFQNNLYFRHTWDYDFAGKALSDKRLIAKLRSEKGRWVDYIIEFSRGIDNLVGYFDMLMDLSVEQKKMTRIDFYFDVFIQGKKNSSIVDYVGEIEKYNQFERDFPGEGELRFIDDVRTRHAEFESLYEKELKAREKGNNRRDLLQFLMDKSEFLNQEENKWMHSVMEVIRTTSLYFQPQIRTKILNEGWASYWHENLFLQDDRISGHEIDFAVVNAKVTSLPRVGLNPYALGMRLFYYIEEQADKGKISYDYQRIADQYRRRKFDVGAGGGKEFIFNVRENFCDAMFIANFIDQEFVDKHKLFVAGKRLNKKRMTWQYYVKSKKARHYRKMVADALYHPPAIKIDVDENNSLVINHIFEGKPLLRDYIRGTMMGIEFLWGNKVILFTEEPEPVKKQPGQSQQAQQEKGPGEVKWKRVKYTMKDRKLNRVLVD
ncbi:SpoVR family protein [Desulforhopalus singaporensis]|uniref:Stage V sporulation protein R n=1 Tax=Desulforhopalus singaporensis TaxID=91360 RepID=A0A1H0QXH1_9BACT|nr:SpoVR family protein [Desulforhopalus singaporensis]SDP21992.1 stage V sporulation protein R [Desulforhopalus singaporensis]